MAKTIKTTLYFAYSAVNAQSEVEKLCNEFPEIKLVSIRQEQARPIIYFDLKYPLKIKENVDLYLKQHKILTLRR